jgi:hypothetical protein
MWWLLWKLRAIANNLFLTFFGYLLPALCSAKAVVSNKDDDIHEWLTYWIVFSFFIFFESLIDFILWKIPFYHELKVLLICWLTLPRTQGAYKLYINIIQPYFERYEEDIDAKISDVSNEIKHHSLKYGKKILWNVVLGSGETGGAAAAAVLGPVQALLGIELIRNTFNLPQFGIPDTVTEIDVPKNQSQVNLFLQSLKSSSLALRLTFANSGKDLSGGGIDCQCRLTGKFYLELTLSEQGAFLSDTQRQERTAIFSRLSRRSSRPSAGSSVYVLSLLDIHSVQTVELEDEEEGGGSSSSDLQQTPLTSIGITFLTKELVEEILFIQPASPPPSSADSWSPLDLSSALVTPSPLAVAAGAGSALESLSSLSHCFQILSSRSRGLVWKKLQIIFLLFARLHGSLLLSRAWDTWKSAPPRLRDGR